MDNIKTELKKVLSLEDLDITEKTTIKDVLNIYNSREDMTIKEAVKNISFENDDSSTSLEMGFSIRYDAYAYGYPNWNIGVYDAENDSFLPHVEASFSKGWKEKNLESEKNNQVFVKIFGPDRTFERVGYDSFWIPEEENENKFIIIEQVPGNRCYIYFEYGSEEVKFIPTEKIKGLLFAEKTVTIPAGEENARIQVSGKMEVDLGERKTTVLLPALDSLGVSSSNPSLEAASNLIEFTPGSGFGIHLANTTNEDIVINAGDLLQDITFGIPFIHSSFGYISN